MTYDLKENEVERELTIYLSQYILQMYKEYLDKKRRDRDGLGNQMGNVDASNGDMTMDPQEESKQDKSTSLKTGDKYIIRKLVSLKITPEQIQDYINMLISGSSNTNSTNYYPSMNYPTYTPTMNQIAYNNPIFMNDPPQTNFQNRSNSCYNDNRPMPFNGVQNMGVLDDSQLVHRFGQFNLVNHNLNYMTNPQNGIDQFQLSAQTMSNSNDMSLDNNCSANAETPLSSVPLHLRNSNRPVRSQSINRVPESSKYMKESFLFDKLTRSNSKDDNTLQKDQNPLKVERPEVKSFVPKILKYNMPDVDNCSSPSISSQSSYFSFNDAASCSSLDMSFDNTGMPYLKPLRASAFAKVQAGDRSDRSSSLSADDKREYDEEIEKELLIDTDDMNNEGEARPQNKSSFFRLKDTQEPNCEQKEVEQ